MKKELKGFIIGVVLTLSISAVADVTQSIAVQPNSINVIANGKKIEADNFLYKDTTYLPLRAVAAALGQKISYDDKTNTAYIEGKGSDDVSTERST